MKRWIAGIVLAFLLGVMIGPPIVRAGLGDVLTVSQLVVNTVTPGSTAAGIYLGPGSLINLYNGLTTVGNGVVAELYNTAPAAGTASIGATTMFTPASAGTFRASFYVTQTVLGTSCSGNSTIQANVIFKDPNAASAQTVATALFTVTTNGTLGQVPLTSGPMSYTFRSSAAAIQYSTTFTAGGSCSPAPTVQVFPVLEAM